MHTFLHRPQSVFLRRVLFQVHLWVGMLAGLYVFVVCVTGAALVFRIDLQRALHPHLFTVQASGPRADPADVLDSVARAYPGWRIAGIDAPTTSRPTYLAYVTQGGSFQTVLIEPVSADVLGELPDRSFVRTLQDLHFDLLAGRTGRVVNGVGALLLLLLCATGVVIWWPGTANWRRGLTVDVRRSWKRVTWDLHGAVGIWTVAFIAMWAVTGVYFAFPSQFRAVVHAISPITARHAPQSAPAPAGSEHRPSSRELVEVARQHVPDRVVARIVLPSSARDAFHVLFSETSPTPAGRTALTSVYLDQFTGARLDEPVPGPRTAGDVVLAWVRPLHTGSFGGVGVKLAWALLGLAPPVLFVTAFLMWWMRIVRGRWVQAAAPEPAPVLTVTKAS